MLNIGIIGTGRIAQRFVAECKAVDDVCVSAIYNPHLTSAQFFATQNNIDVDKVLLTDDIDIFFGAVDAVYVASPHTGHASYTRQALEANKHVLCEKPFALSVNDAWELYDLANKKGLICFEAIKTAYCPGFHAMLQLIENGVIGLPYDVEATFTKIGSASGREMWGEAAGSFAELASYVLLPVVKIFGGNVRESYYYSVPSATGCDSFTKCCLSYAQGTATIRTGLGVKSEGELIVAGEKGYIKVPAPWWLTRRVEVHHENPDQVEIYEAKFEGAGLRYEINAFKNAVRLMDNLKEDAKTETISARDIWNELEATAAVSADESIWMASQIETYLQNQKEILEENGVLYESPVGKPDIFAHRGCSYRYPENTLLAFEKAANVKRIAGIEFDVQLTSDGEVVVIHDEKVDRTTDGTGFVRDYTLAQLKELHITPSGVKEPFVDGEGNTHTIPTFLELLELLTPYCKKNGLMLNIELKNSVYPYTGMEQKVIAMVEEFGLQDNIIYSSFNHASLAVVKEYAPYAKTATLNSDIYNCIDGMVKYQADGLHPGSVGMAINADAVKWLVEENIPIRMWNSTEPLFGQVRTLPNPDLEKYAKLGAQVIMTNVPEDYLVNR